MDKLHNPSSSLIWVVDADQTVFLIIAYIFVFAHMGLIIWMYMVPYGLRRKMVEKDKQYEQLITSKKRGNDRKGVEQKVGGCFGFSHVPFAKVVQHYVK
jgi:hypothetical protein